MEFSKKEEILNKHPNISNSIMDNTACNALVEGHGFIYIYTLLVCLSVRK